MKNRSKIDSLKFQVMPPHGGNVLYPYINGVLYQFQVMPPHGGNTFKDETRVVLESFKSCPRMGATERRIGKVQVHKVSSHAPAWGQH